MKKNKFTLVLMAVILISGKCLAQSQEDMKKYEEYMAVGPMQQMMAKSVGVWSANITMWTNPGADPMSSTEEVTYAMIMGGRYLQYTSKGQMYGMPFEGVSTTGYDNDDDGRRRTRTARRGPALWDLPKPSVSKLVQNASRQDCLH